MKGIKAQILRRIEKLEEREDQGLEGNKTRSECKTICAEFVDSLSW